MIDHPADTPCTNDGEASTASGKIPTEWVSPVSLLSNPLYGEVSLPVLAALCMKELNTYRRGEPCPERYSIELLRRATLQGDHEARAWVQHCFAGVVLNWLYRHPKRAHACRLKTRNTTWLKRLSASGRLPPHTKGWNSLRLLRYCAPCLPVCMVLSWICSGWMRGREKARGLCQQGWENHTWKM